MRSVVEFGLLAVSLASIISLASCQMTLQRDKVCWSECKGKLREETKLWAFHVTTSKAVIVINKLCEFFLRHPKINGERNDVVNE